MKKLITILFLAPLMCFGQSKLDSSLTASPFLTLSCDTCITSSGSLSPFSVGSSSKYNIRSWVVTPLMVTDKDGKRIAEVDSCNNLHVYTDTTNVLKTIIRAYGIKVN